MTILKTEMISLCLFEKCCVHITTLSQQSVFISIHKNYKNCCVMHARPVVCQCYFVNKHHDPVHIHIHLQSTKYKQTFVWIDNGIDLLLQMALDCNAASFGNCWSWIAQKQYCYYVYEVLVHVCMLNMYTCAWCHCFHSFQFFKCTSKQ